MPANIPLVLVLLFAINACTDNEKEFPIRAPEVDLKILPQSIRGISLPPGFYYVENKDSIYSNWLLDLRLRRLKTVYLYNGEIKSNQNSQHSVLDIDIGKKDLLQCADAVIKLRADHLFEQHRYKEIRFFATSGDVLSFEDWRKGIRWKERSGKLMAYQSRKVATNIQEEYDAFMEIAFSYCGTYSLSKQMHKVTEPDSIQAGDVFVQGGFPGHAITVMAVAINETDEKIFLLSQGYMPAQDIHLLKNTVNPELSPWYSSKEMEPLYTPQWKFEKKDLKRW